MIAAIRWLVGWTLTLGIVHGVANALPEIFRELGR